MDTNSSEPTPNQAAPISFLSPGSSTKYADARPLRVQGKKVEGPVWVCWPDGNATRLGGDKQAVDITALKAIRLEVEFEHGSIWRAAGENAAETWAALLNAFELQVARCGNPVKPLIFAESFTRDKAF